MKKNFALIGYGSWGKKVSEEIKINKNFNLKYIVSKSVKQNNKDIKFYKNLEEILSFKKLDCIYVAKNPNTNFNLWNIDLNFEWWFAPGSNLVFLYRNQIFNRDNNSGLDYYKSLKNLFDIPIEHQLSLRLNYLIDVNRFRRK